MRTLVASLLSLAATSAAAFAQSNDECFGALYVAQGANGPFNNSAATVSLPWTCAFGDTDVWFLYVAPASGTLTVDVCGAGFDTTMEVFDGAAGCGTLASLGCNDDSCGLASQVTVAVTVGGTYYIRVGGYGGDTGTFTLNVNGPTGTGTIGTGTATGAGCIRSFASLLEYSTAPAFDLGGSAFTLVNLQNGYLALPLGSFVAPSGAATVLALGDDAEVTRTLTVPFPYPGGTATSLNVCSNGYVSVASNGTDFDPTVSAMLSAPATGWWMWHDFNPNAAGSGSVKFEEVGSVAYITWDGVYDFGGTSAADANTFQLQFDSATGNVTYAWGTMSTGGNDFLVGYSPGGPNSNPGNTDLSVAVPLGGVQTAAVDIAPLALYTAQRPVTGSTWGLSVQDIPATGVLGVEIFGASNPNIADLTFLGMPGCGLFASLDYLNAFVVTGATHSYGLSVPANPGLIGVQVHSQAAVFQIPPVNAFGAISSNGQMATVGNL